MWTIFQQAVRDIVQISDMTERFNSVIANLEANIIYFGQLLSCAKQEEFHFVAVQFEKVLSQTDVDFIDTLLNPGNTVTFRVGYIPAMNLQYNHNIIPKNLDTKQRKIFYHTSLE